ncbi:MAG: NAD(P)H-hydrate dehydratase [Patescibacteria group bacterium]
MKKITRSILKHLYHPPKNSRKGENGVLLIIAGSEKYHGAPWYAIEIASKIVDLIYFYSVSGSMKLMREIKKNSPAFITINSNELNDTVKKSDVILIGPGWGVSSENKKALNSLLINYKDKKFVLDADALKMADKKLLNTNCLVTPHPGEFEKLFGIKASPENCARMAKNCCCYIVLKGKNDYVCSLKECFINTTGNEGMTKGGTGDVLSGLVAALACKNDLFLAGQVGVLINGLAGDNLYKKVGVYYNAGDLIEEIPKVLNIRLY